MRRLKKLLKIAGILVASYIALALATPFVGVLHDRSCRNQINYISSQFDAGADFDLQRMYPEGFVFGHAIFGLSVVEYSASMDGEKKLREYAKLVDRSVGKLLSEEATRPFSSSLAPSYGAFYNGWTNFLLKKYIHSSLFKYSKIGDDVVDEHSILTAAIVATQQDSVAPVDTYVGTVWPGDNMACIASLPDEYHALQMSWFESLQSESQADSLLLDHVLSGDRVTRGSSQALCLYFLAQIDKSKAIEYNGRFTSLFQDRMLGVDFIKEHDTSDGYYDIDSGPVICGYGSVATIMNTKAQASLGDNHPRWTWATLNLAGMPIHIFGKKYYLGKRFLMFDIFMLWCSQIVEEQ